MKNKLFKLFLLSSLAFVAFLYIRIGNLHSGGKIKYSEIAVERSATMLYPVVKLTHVGMKNAKDVFSISATGFSVSYNEENNTSIIVTNDHFCKEMTIDSSLYVENYALELIDWAELDGESRIIKTRPELDLCAVLLSGYVHPVEMIDEIYLPQLFEKVFVVGAPSGDFPIILDTYISAFLNRDRVKIIHGPPYVGSKFIMISEEILPGHSGSPVYTRGGKAIGVIFGALPHYGGLVISAEDIRLFLEDI